MIYQIENDGDTPQFTKSGKYKIVIYDEAGNTVYTVKGKLAWGHCLKIYDSNGNELGTVKERIFTFLPKFETII